MKQDKRILSAKEHWAGRMVTNGVPLSDFLDVTNNVSVWKDWCKTWSKKGDLHRELGDAAISENKTISAAEHLRTAAVCYHFGRFLFVDFPEEMREAHQKSVECYNKALPLFNPSGKRLSIPYEGKHLYGNLRVPKSHFVRPPVVILILGLDSTKEEMFTYESVFLERGIATFSFDGPGQGEGEYDFFMCPEYEKPVTAVIERLKEETIINTKKIGLWGVSMGGYYAPRAAAFCKDVSACISLSGPFNLNQCFDSLPELTSTAVIYRSGSKEASDVSEFTKRMSLREVASKIECPLYIVSGALDRVIPPKQGELLEKAAENSSEVIHQIIPNGGHVANNVSYFYRNKCADWMTEKLNS